MSVLFADLVGSTSIAEARDPEAVRELLSLYFTTARAIVERHGGTVEKFIGDAVMAVWGAPTAHEDDARRAVRAALELVEGVAALRDRTGIAELDARAAVHTGQAAVTLGAQGQGLVAGDLVNTAARLQGVARPGSVLVGLATHSATRDSIVYEPAGSHQVKGRSQPIEAWRAVRIAPGDGRSGTTDRQEAPFVGRAAELRALTDALAATRAEGRARFVSISGQAGIGKSRLALELERQATRLAEPIRWHRGRSPSYGDAIAYHALAEIVRGALGLPESDSPSVAAAGLSAALDTLVADADDRRWIEPHLLALLGLGGSAGADREEQLGAWRRFVEALTMRGTVVLVFEDLHWADDGLLDFIDSLLEWSRDRPILVVAIARPELGDRRPRLGAASHTAVALHLEPLTGAEMKALLAGVAPELDEDLAAAVVARADGVPLYAIELVRMIRDADPTGGAGATGAFAAPARLVIPPSLQALVAARLDGLPREDRSLLQDAAVLGQAFTLPGLAAISGVAATTLEPRLRALVRSELLSLDRDPRSPERGQYAFVQSVVHEVALGTLARRDRRARHLAAARHLESLGDPSFAAVVATHYLEAYRASPDDAQAEAVRDQARLALRAAAERSAQLHSHDQAVADLDRCLELTDDPTERAGILVRQAELSEAGGNHAEAIARADRARAAYAALGDGRAALRAGAIIGRAEMRRGRWEDAAALLERSLADLDPAVDPGLYARLAAEFARTHMIGDRFALGLEWTERALAAAGAGRDVEVIAEAMATRGVCLEGVGRLDEGVAILRASIELAAAHHLSATELRARYNLGGRLMPEDLASGIATVETGVEVARRTGRRDWLMNLSGMLAAALIAAYRFDDALAALDGVPDQDRAPEDSALAIAYRGQIAALRGAGDTWPAALERARALVREVSNPQLRWELASIASAVAMAEGRFDDVAREATEMQGSWAPWRTAVLGRAAVRAGDLVAARAVSEAWAADGAQLAVVGIERLALTAGLAGLEGRRTDAVEGYLDAIRRARQVGDQSLLGDLLVDAIHVLGPDDPAVRSLTADARALFERAGARALLDRLDEALTRPRAWRRSPA